MEQTPIAQGPVDVTVMGICGACKHRDSTGHCNSEKLAEDWGQSGDEKMDMLLYDHSEGGGFWVGEKFGCIHYTPNV